MYNLLRTAILSTVLLLGAATIGFAQKEKEKTEEEYLIQKDASGNFQYSEVFNYDSTKTSQADAYKAAKRYVLSTLKTADNNIVSDDAASTELVNNGNLMLKPQSGFGYAVTSASFDFKLKLYFKPGRYKVTVDNIVVHAIQQSGNTIMPVTQSYSDLRNNKPSRKFKGSIDDTLLSFISGLKGSIEGKGSENDSKW